MTNIAEILKNAPKGLKLYSLIWGEVTLSEVYNSNESVFPVEIAILSPTTTALESFTKEGKYSTLSDGECLLFPSKDHRTWSDWQRWLFKVGDVVTKDGVYLYLLVDSNDPEIAVDSINFKANLSDLENYRYATLEERERFFKDLESNGYKWDADTLTLEKKRMYEEMLEGYNTDKILARLDRIYDLLVAINGQRYIPFQARPLCYEQGGTCTNPQMDCINCPRLHNGGGNTTTWTTNSVIEKGGEE